MPLAAMPSLVPRWKKKKPSTFKELSSSDRDYLVDVLRATAPNHSEEPDQTQQDQDEPVSEYQNEEEPAQTPLQPALDEPTSTEPPPPPTSASASDEPALPKPTFESFLRIANSTIQCWETRDTFITNSTKAKLASTFSLEINSYMKEYAAKTRAVSSRGHIHRIVEQCVLARRNLREIRDLLQDLGDYEPVDDFVRRLMEDTWRVMVSLEHDNWIEVEYALEHQ
jgi:hypothetical protein